MDTGQYRMVDEKAVSSKACSRKPTGEQPVIIPQSRNASGMKRIASVLGTSYPHLPSEDKQMILTLAAALMSGDLGLIRRTVDGLNANIRHLAMLRDTLGVIMHVSGQTSVQLMPGEIFTTNLGPGKNVEALYFTLKCTRTNEAVGVPSHMAMPAQVFKTMFMGTDNKVLQTDERSEPGMVFRRISGLMAHSDQSAPPPPWQPSANWTGTV